MRHLISILLENESGALSRVAGLFSARAYNIESLSVAPTDDPSLSRMTIVTTGTEDIIEQINKQLNKLIDVVKLMDMTEGPHIEREMMLVKVNTEGDRREELKRDSVDFYARIRSLYRQHRENEINNGELLDDSPVPGFGGNGGQASSDDWSEEGW